jgi:tetratricopeptide (TPR) repeat protein
MGEFERSLACYREAMDVASTLYPSNHPRYADIYLHLHRLYDAAGAVEKGSNYRKLYIDVKRRFDGALQTANFNHKVAEAYREYGNRALTIKSYTDALNKNINSAGSNNYLTAGAYNDLGLAYMFFGDFGMAIDNFGKSLSIFERLYGEGDSSTAAIFDNIALAYRSTQRYDRALQFYVKSLAVKEKNLGKRDSNTLETYLNIYRIYREMGDRNNSNYFYNIYLQNGGDESELV